MDPTSNPNPFGRGLTLIDGDLPLLNGDFRTLAGQDNLLQGLNVMIDTPFATDIFNVSYGFDLLNALASGQTPKVTQDVIRLNIVKSIGTDNRIREVKEVVFDDDPPFYDLSPQSDPVDRSKIRRNFRSWQAIVVLRTTSDTDIALSLRGLGI